jgi:hypothetical protein
MTSVGRLVLTAACRVDRRVAPVSSLVSSPPVWSSSRRGRHRRRYGECPTAASRDPGSEGSATKGFRARRGLSRPLAPVRRSGRLRGAGAGGGHDMKNYLSQSMRCGRSTSPSSRPPPANSSPVAMRTADGGHPVLELVRSPVGFWPGYRPSALWCSDPKESAHLVRRTRPKTLVGALVWDDQAEPSGGARAADQHRRAYSAVQP